MADMNVYMLRFLAVFVLAPVIVLPALCLWRPRRALCAVPICAGLDLLVYMGEFLYYESRPLALLFLAIQAAAIAFCALLIRFAAKRRQ